MKEFLGNAAAIANQLGTKLCKEINGE